MRDLSSCQAAVFLAGTVSTVEVGCFLQAVPFLVAVRRQLVGVDEAPVGS